MIAAGKVQVADLITHILPLALVETGLRIVAERSGMKVLLYPATPEPTNR
jgi:threonine dehydrogenase-like Zn-dependent dehydrogenase